MGVVKDGCCQSGHDTLEENVPQEWKDRTNWFFVYCYKFRKAKSCFRLFMDGCGYFSL